MEFPNRKYQAQIGSLVNSAKYLNVSYLQSLQKIEAEREYFLTHSVKQHHSNAKTRHSHYKKNIGQSLS